MAKICIRCGVEKDITEFYRERNQCKECRKEYHKQYYKKNSEKIKENTNQYREKNTEKVSTEALEKYFEELYKRGLTDVQREGFKQNRIQIFPFLDMRYSGQSYEITIPFRKNSAITSDFHRAHQKLYSYHHPNQPTEIVNLRIKAVGIGKKIKPKTYPFSGSNPKKAFVKKQPLHFKGKEFEAAVYDRSLITPGNRLTGPALVADYESTAFIPPLYTGVVDSLLNLVIHKRGQKHESL